MGRQSGKPEPPAADGEKLAMPVIQLDARQLQRQFPRPVKLFAGQHCRSQTRALRPVILIRCAVIALGNSLRR
jgi:hypothetical protein